MLTNATKPESESGTLVLDGQPLCLAEYADAVDQRVSVSLSKQADVLQRVQDSARLVQQAVQQGLPVYGVTTGFGGMADQPVPAELAGELQNNLLSFLAAGAGAPIAARHVRGAMVLRANVLLQGCSGVRMEIIERLVKFLNADAIPIVRELGSIGASGDLVPLSTIARAITGQNPHVEVQWKNRCWKGNEILQQLGLPADRLLPKEGLALVNGTSFSAAVAANVVRETNSLLALSTAVQALLLRALLVQRDPFEAFVHQCKPHPGQVWSAQIMRQWLDDGQNQPRDESRTRVQDRYSLRCLPQYLGPIVEGLGRIQQVVQTEMNSVSDNPLIDTSESRFYQCGNFLGQYLSVGMDELRNYIGLLAKHLDVQIAMLVAPEFNGGLSASLRGNDQVPHNMGLKGLQICGNSIMPLLTWYGNPLVQHYPTHAEQFNQNINGLSWGSANLAWQSVSLFQQYMAISLIFAVQALDLRAREQLGHCDGRSLLGPRSRPLYEAACQVLNHKPGGERPLLFNDKDRWLEQDVACLVKDIQHQGCVTRAVQPILESFQDQFGSER